MHLFDVARMAALSLLWGLIPYLALLAQNPAGEDRKQDLPILTTTRAAHQLSAGEAARGYPVRLRAVVTYFDADIDPRRLTLFAHDSTGSIYVALASKPMISLQAGNVVEISGKSAPGDFARIVDDAQARVVGEAPLPALAPRVTMPELLTGGYDGQWVELEGVVYSARQIGKNMMLELALNDGMITAATVRDPAVDYAGLIDARIVIRGNTGPLFNHRGQLTGAHLLFPGLSTVRVVEAARARPFQSPAMPIGSLMTYTPGIAFGHRQHVRGQVTLFWPGRLLCIRDATEGLCAETAQTDALLAGQMADLIGFPIHGEFAPRLTRATYVAGKAGLPVAATAVTAAEAKGGDYDGELVAVEGRLLGEDKAAPDPTIMISSGRFIYAVVLPQRAGGGAPSWEPGSTLKLTGICSVQSDESVRSPGTGFAVAKSFRLLLRSPGDVVVLERPSWWNAEHTLRVLTLALGITVCILAWVAYLRVRLKKQTRLLQYQATHDALTGIWNRRAVLDLLNREYALAARAGRCVGVMMLDADHFKKINDTYGHLAGDAVLKELARRIQMAVRSSDLIGRYGGEEFLTVLTECTGDEVEACAERIRAAIADEPMIAEGIPLRVTVSVGTAVLDPLLNSERDALAAADGALYQAKHAGRNRVVCGRLTAVSP